MRARISGIRLYSLYESYAGTTSEHSLYPKICTNCVCYNETPLYVNVHVCVNHLLILAVWAW